MSADTAAPPVLTSTEQEIDDPTDLRWEDYKIALRATKEEMARDDVSSMAAGVAFRIFLALVPTLLAAVAIFSLVMDPQQLEDLVDRLAGVVPADALSVIQRTLENIIATQSGAAASVLITGVLGGLWAATAAAATLVRALNRAYEVTESRNAIKQRLIALALTFALLVAISALVVLIIAGPQLQRAVVPEALQGTAANLAFGALQGLLALAVLALLFAFVYWLAPNRALPRWVWMSPGAVVGVIGWLVVSLGFTLYVQNFGNYDNATYGALGGVIVLMVWLQLSMTLLLIGGEFNAEVERVKAQHDAVSSGAGMGGPGPNEEMADLAETGLMGGAPGLAPAMEPGLAPAMEPGLAPAMEPGLEPAIPQPEPARATGAAPAGAQPRTPGGRGQHAQEGPSPSALDGRALAAGAVAVVAAGAALIGFARSRG